MFTTNYKQNPFEIYNIVLANITNIKNVSSFSNFTVIPATELITISNTIMDCVDKLCDISVLYINKINNQTLPNGTIEQLKSMSLLHEKLLEQFYSFNKISSDITEGFKESYTKTLNQEIINYIFYDIANRYRMIILQIIESLKKLNSFVELVKNKI